MQIYEPQEDSYLLEESVKKYAKGSVLDMGTGSGIQAETALKKKRVTKVTVTDINKSCSKLLPSKIKFIHSNLFNNVPLQKFDTIIFNPPYLPQDKGIEDIALYGGKKGYEIIERFLNSCSSYLAANGTILLLFSSHTNKSKVDEIIGNNCLEKEEMASKQLPMLETLYVYKIRKSKLLLLLEKKKINCIKKFAKGKRGIIYVGNLKGKKVAIKVKLRDSLAKGNIANEVKWLKILNKKNIGPRLISSSKNYFIYEFIDGKFIADFINNCDSKKIITATLKNILQQCRTLDKLKVNKAEMHHPHKHIIVKNNRPALIDFERCRKTKKPKNVTQFCQFIVSGYFMELLEEKGIEINKRKVLIAAKKYKKDQSGREFRKLSSVLF